MTKESQPWNSHHRDGDLLILPYPLSGPLACRYRNWLAALAALGVAEN